MKNLETLIQELCPDGVEFVKLGDVCKISRGKVYSKKYLAEHIGEYPVYSSQTANDGILGRIGTYDCDGKFLTWTTDGAYAGTVFYRQGKFSVTNVCGLISCSNPFLSLKFLYYWLTIEAPKHVHQGMGNPKLMSNQMAKIEIPLPPIDVQIEIVRILDKFISLEAELEAELDCRKRQYEYYRDKLLSFDNVGGQEVEWKKMSEVFDMKNGYTPSKAKAEYWEGGTIPWFRMEDIRENGRILSDSIQHITMVGVKKGKLFPANSFILATTATIGEHALVISDSLANQQFTNLTVRKSLSDRLLIKFVFHYMFIVDEWCKKNINVSGFASVDMNKFKKLEFPIPSLEEQHRIVSILDRFESLTTSLQSGLPAEITARRQQYEHYRDKLLTFKRKGAV